MQEQNKKSTARRYSREQKVQAVRLVHYGWNVWVPPLVGDLWLFLRHLIRLLNSSDDVGDLYEALELHRGELLSDDRYV